jgi:biotin carboxyl carrier protein
MKVLVRVEGRSFEVEVGDLSALPIIAVVEGQRFEVWPSSEQASQGEAASPGIVQAPAQDGLPPAGAAGEGEGPAVKREGTVAAGGPVDRPTAQRSVRAPIPGVIESVAVRVGDRVARGDELLVLEAMKMRNVIRAPRAGVISAVRVTAGQHINHNDLLVEYGN